MSKEFRPNMADDIVVRNVLGVCSAEEDTRLLAQVSAEVAPQGGRALDVGTGTGYVAIYLARSGLAVDAVDVSGPALELARQNAATNSTVVNVYHSDLFSDVRGRYDVIAFNPPMNPDETDTTRLVTSFLRRHKTLANPLMQVFDRFMDSTRIAFLVAFLNQAREHLQPGGNIVLELTRLEIDELAAQLREFEFGRRVDIPRLPTEQIVVIRPVAETGAK
jgi:methylase of polypeptide subunit release factors